jgi:hypothetical protein
MKRFAWSSLERIDLLLYSKAPLFLKPEEVASIRLLTLLGTGKAEALRKLCLLEMRSCSEVISKLPRECSRDALILSIKT